MNEHPSTQSTNPLDQRIVDFLTEHHVLTLATHHQGQTWCANCFYAFDAAAKQLILTSSVDTLHGRQGLTNPQVAGSVVLETSIVGKIQGVQFTGVLRLLDGPEHDAAQWRYLKRFPFAVLKKSELWSIDLYYVKLTDNRLGFGKKIIWPTDQPVL